MARVLYVSVMLFVSVRFLKRIRKGQIHSTYMKNEFANNYKVALTKQKLDVYQANVITHYYVFYKIDQSDLRMEQVT